MIVHVGSRSRPSIPVLRQSLKAPPRITSKIVPLVKNLAPDINRIVKRFASYFKTRLVQAHPEACPGNVQSGDGLKSCANGFQLTARRVKSISSFQ